MRKRTAHIVCGLALVLSCVTPAVAFACGVPGAGGVAGVATLCNLKDRPRLKPLRFRVSAGVIESATTIVFSGADEVRLERTAVSAAFEWRLRDDLSLSFSAGAMLRGRMWGAEQATVQPGALAAVTLSWRIVEPVGQAPLVLWTNTVSFVWHQTLLSSGERVPYTAFDLRTGIVVGKTFWNMFTPYAVARLFGGPVYWRVGGQAAQGTDKFHFQVGAGAVLSLKRIVDLYVEAVPLGELAAVAGAGVSF